MNWLKRFLFGHWRNKGVALFFSVIIWFVAYQSEKQDADANVLVTFQPEQPERYVITSLTRPLGEDREEAFEGRVQISLEGPRKQVDEWMRYNLVQQANLPLQVSPEDEVVHLFREEDFNNLAGDAAVPPGVRVTGFSPKSVRIRQDKWGEKVIGDLSARLEVDHRFPHHEVASKRANPDSVTLQGPQSLLDFVDVRLSVTMERFSLGFDGEADVEIFVADESFPDSEELLVSLSVEPSRVHVEVRLEQSKSIFTPESDVPITYRVPPGVTIRIDAPDALPLSFTGPPDQIDQLRRDFATNPTRLLLSVPIPPVSQLSPGPPRLLTFTEDSLELSGYPGVKVAQRDEVRRTKGGLFEYELIYTEQEQGGN